MSIFQMAVQLVLKNEGGYTDDADDAGNWTGGKIGVGELKGTNFGISAKSYPDLDIKNLTQEQAIEIYQRDYWNKNGLGRILDQQVATKLFDMCVNLGPQRAVAYMQRAIWAVNTYNCTSDDGVLGPITINFINGATISSSTALLSAFKSECAGYYRLLVALDNNRKKFLLGWLSRIYA